MAGEPSQKPTATLGGKPLLASSAVGWSLTEGTTPHIRTFDMAPADAISISRSSSAITLSITLPDGRILEITNLWVMNIAPGPNPFISRVTVADRRWMWSYGHVGPRYYNMRRNVGVKRILANDQFAVPFDRAPQVQYWAASLDKGRRWEPYSMLQDVLKAVQEIEKKHAGTSFGFTIDQDIGFRIKGLPIEELLIDDQGDRAVDRAAAYLPEAGITVYPNGTVAIFSKASGKEADILKAVMPEIRNEGHSDLVKNSLIRPREIHVLFTRECEVRWDFIEQTSALGTTAEIGTARRAENVIPITDYQLTVAGSVLPQSTWITMDQAFVAWGDIPLVGGEVPFDHSIVQQAMIPHMDLWSVLQLVGDRPNEDGDLKNWGDRIAALQSHYRRTFRINRQWMDRILSLRAYRIATIDPQSGQRGPARAYGDYAILNSQRSVWRNIAQEKPLDYCINRTAYPSSGILDNTARVSPATVEIVDHDQGIFHVDYKIDPNRVYEMILPSQVKLSTMPTANVTQRERSITFDSIMGSTEPPTLSPDFKLAVVMTAVPGTKHQIHRIIVKPNDISGLLPPSQQTGLNDARGPIMEIRIGENVEVARIQWKDSEAETIERIFQVPADAPDPEDEKVRALCINESRITDLERGGSLNLIAKARAAAVYASLVDRFEGSSTGYLNPNVKLAGWTSQITHELRQNAETVTRVEFPENVPQFDLVSFLDSNTRAAILRLAQPQ